MVVDDKEKLKESVHCKEQASFIARCLINGWRSIASSMPDLMSYSLYASVLIQLQAEGFATGAAVTGSNSTSNQRKPNASALIG